ncbi:DUF1573 domain-containing protein [Algoriphagus marinus]|uniref:DUF1573 domain-containing protein n=1 Tax=Algoriphagus marinus TaxID=1925762 RepID=UPI00094B8E4C|nr:DUF1573 domain-containing protein [Algoriphagus marinus]
MKKSIILIFIVVFSTIISIIIKRALEENYVPEISFEIKKYDFDTLTTQEEADVYFVYGNLGKKDLKVYDIKTSCGCTIPAWNDGFLKPYEKDSFKVTYNIENKGYFIKEIMVYSNSKTSPDRLEVMGYVPFE